MFTTRVRKDELLTILKENRTNHKATFDKAVKYYGEELLRLLEQKLEEVKAGRKIAHALNLPVPEEHTGDYDRVIRMLEMSLDEELEMDEHQFDQYVNDIWDWQRSWASNTTAYTAGRP